MSDQSDYYRLSPTELQARLDRAGLSVRELARLTGTRSNTAARWLLSEDHPRAVEPPFWLTSWLELVCLPGGLDVVRVLADVNLISEGSSDAS